MCKLTSSTQLAVFLFVDSWWHEPHDAVQSCTHGSTFEFLFEFQTELFSNFLFEFCCSSIKPFDYRGSTVYRKLHTTHTKSSYVVPCMYEGQSLVSAGLMEERRH